MDTFQLITIKSSDPFIRGLQYGQQAEALIHLGIEGYQRHFSKTLDLTWKDITERAASIWTFWSGSSRRSWRRPGESQRAAPYLWRTSWF